jgi:hypothetical protein
MNIMGTISNVISLKQIRCIILEKISTILQLDAARILDTKIPMKLKKYIYVRILDGESTQLYLEM